MAPSSSIRRSRVEGFQVLDDFRLLATCRIIARVLREVPQEGLW